MLDERTIRKLGKVSKHTTESPLAALVSCFLAQAVQSWWSRDAVLAALGHAPDGGTPRQLDITRAFAAKVRDPFGCESVDTFVGAHSGVRSKKTTGRSMTQKK